jgi:hypothetical protein
VRLLVLVVNAQRTFNLDLVVMLLSVLIERWRSMNKVVMTQHSPASEPVVELSTSGTGSAGCNPA